MLSDNTCIGASHRRPTTTSIASKRTRAQNNAGDARRSRSRDRSKKRRPDGGHHALSPAPANRLAATCVRSRLRSLGSAHCSSGGRRRRTTAGDDGRRQQCNPLNEQRGGDKLRARDRPVDRLATAAATQPSVVCCCCCRAATNRTLPNRLPPSLLLPPLLLFGCECLLRPRTRRSPPLAAVAAAAVARACKRSLPPSCGSFARAERRTLTSCPQQPFRHLPLE